MMEGIRLGLPIAVLQSFYQHGFGVARRRLREILFRSDPENLQFFRPAAGEAA